MTYRDDIDDALLTKMYADESNRISDLETHFDACAGTLRRHLHAEGVETARKVSTPWNINEEWLLYDAKEKGLTGAELQSAIPTRTLYGIKGHVVSMKGRGVDIR